MYVSILEYREKKGPQNFLLIITYGVVYSFFFFFASKCTPFKDSLEFPIGNAKSSERRFRLCCLFQVKGMFWNVLKVA